VQLWQLYGPKPRGQTPKLSGPQLEQSLVFHVLCGVGTLAAHVQQLTGVKVSDSDLSQRRTAAGVGVFEAIVRAALRPLATLAEHPAAFYRSWRLVGIDGSQTSVSNTPQLLCHLSKAAKGSSGYWTWTCVSVSTRYGTKPWGRCSTYGCEMEGYADS